ncbi:hypothetical protein OsccyDRAFT_1423 [Leptolyngbyaceae cyanobacterium JSC-12]|nr:hypothetical protein OsccyDRAFT_1423 [Leptolyngbyaceae cyanobacterium JSC-12]
MSRWDTDGQQPEDLEFDQELANVERSLQELKQRYIQVQQDLETQAQLQERQEIVKRQIKQHATPQLKAELTQIETQLEELEVNLESRLFTWGSLRESFWQIVRFGGLGIVIGWFLAFAVLQEPRPTSPPTNSSQSNSSQP